MKTPNISIDDHSRGMTVRHEGPFSHLEVTTTMDALSPALVGRWVEPYYLTNFSEPSSDQMRRFAESAAHLDSSILGSLLAEADWRPRVVGAAYVAAVRAHEHTELMGRLLLRSDVCFAGHAYCVAFAVLNRPECIGFLGQYLDYYLSKPQLQFDQGSALAAVIYLDEINGTDLASPRMQQWEVFVQDKPHWSLSNYLGRVRRAAENLTRLSAGAV
jgi:hypothetical protein